MNGLTTDIRSEEQEKNLRLEFEQSAESLKKLEDLNDNLAHMVLHDIRNLLQIVSGEVQLLQRTKLDAIQKSKADEIFNVVVKIAEMSNTVIDIDRLEQGHLPLEKQRHEIGVIISEALRMLGGLQQSCHIRTEVFEGPLYIHCDANLIKRVLFNLLDNAVKYTKPEDMVTVSANRSDKGINVCVADNGPGIPFEFHQRIFEKYGQAELRRNNVPSSGLGLAFCKIVLEAHQGEIGVRSIPGQGSVFWFELPV